MMSRNQSLVSAAFVVFACSSAALAASFAAGPDFGGARPVNLSLDSFSISPEVLHLKAGQPILLRIANDSGNSHDLTAPDFFAQSAMAAADRAKIKAGRLSLRASQSEVLRLTPR